MDDGAPDLQLMSALSNSISRPPGRSRSRGGQSSSGTLELLGRESTPIADQTRDEEGSAAWLATIHRRVSQN
jgi:hypothetical protein